MYVLISVPIGLNFTSKIEEGGSDVVARLLEDLDFSEDVVEQMMSQYCQLGDDISFGYVSSQGLTAEHVHLARDLQLALGGDDPKVPNVLEENVEIRVYPGDTFTPDPDQSPIMMMRYVDQGNRDGVSQSVWMVPDNFDEM